MTIKDLKNLITNENTKAEKGFTEIPEVVTKAVKELNEKQKNAFCLRVGKDKETFNNMFLCSPVTVAESMSKPSEIANAIKYACAYKSYKVVLNDANLIELADALSPIYFSDIVKAITESNADKHADKKPTKADRQKAEETVINYSVKLLNALITHNAQIYTSRGNTDGTDETRNTNETYKKAYDIINKEYTDKGKENPFDKMSGNGLTAQIRELATAFEVSTDNLTKYHCIALYQTIATVNKRTATRTIGNFADMVDAFAIVNRYATNDIKIPDFDKSNIYRKPKTDK